MIKQSILEKAKEIVNKRKKAFDEFEAILSAGICPTCGENLILQTKKWTTKEKRRFIFKTEIEVLHKCERFACPNGHSIIDPDGYDKSNPGCIEYAGHDNPNKIIRDEWLRHYSGDEDDFGG